MRAIARILSGATVALLLAHGEALAQAPGGAQAEVHAGRVDEAELNAADDLYKAGSLQEAIAAYQALLKAHGEGQDALRLALRMASAQYQSGDIPSAYATLRPRMDTPFWDQQSAINRDQALELIADLSSQTGRKADALDYARKLVVLRGETNGPNAIETQVGRLSIAAMLDVPETEAEANKIRNDALDIIKKGADFEHYLRLVNSVVLIAVSNRRFESAERLYNRLLEGYRSLPESVELGIVQLNMAIMYRDWGRYDEAVKRHLAAIDVLERLAGATSADTIAAISGLGRTYSFAGRPAAALPHLRDAYQRAQRAFGDNQETMARAENLAEALRSISSFAEAEKLDRRNLEWHVANLGPTDERTLNQRKMLALDLIGLDRPAEAKAEYDIIVATLEASRGKDDPMTREFAESANRIAVLIGQAPPDSIALESLADDADATGENVLKANYMAGIAGLKGDAAEELRLYRLALKLSDAHFGELHQRTLVMLANVARTERQRRSPDAIATYADLERRLRLWSRREYASSSDDAVLEDIARSTRDSLGDILSYSYAALREDEEALKLYTRVFSEWKAIGTTERAVLQAAEPSMSTDDKALVAKVRELQQKSLSLPRNANSTVERELAIAETALSERVAGLGSDEADTGYQPVLDRLEPGEAIVDYMIAPVRNESNVVVDNVFAIVGQYGGHVGVDNLGELEDVAGPLLNGGGRSDRSQRRDLYKRLIGRFETRLEGVKKITFVPDGILNLAPFDGLIDAKGKNLIETRDVRIARSARSFSAGREKAVEPGGVLLVGEVDYGAGSTFAPLPYTGVEVDSIAKTMTGAAFKPTLVEADKADEKSVRAAAGGNRIIHFATHGFFQPVSANETAPLWRAGIALKGANLAGASTSSSDDGILHAAELTGWPLGGVELVVLSACDTAQGDRSYVEGLSGLPSALAAAGAKRSLLARWPVDDKGAANFMTRFYENLANKRGYAAALRQTKLDAIAGTIEGVSDDTWLAFALIENERSAPAKDGEQVAAEADVMPAKASPATGAPNAEGTCGPTDRGAVPC